VLVGLIQAIQHGSRLSGLFSFYQMWLAIDSFFFANGWLVRQYCVIHTSHSDAAVKGLLSIVLMSLLTNSVVALALQISNVVLTQSRTIMQPRTIIL
jgi:hypothetical protein